MKLVINRCYGGFNLSDAGVEMYSRLVDTLPDDFSAYSIPRDDKVLVQVVEALGEDAGGDCSALKILEIPDGVDWIVQEYDGFEWIAERHRTWG